MTRGTDRETSTEQDPRPLAGWTVVDLTTFLSGPFCTQILGDLGADVIKVEPLTGDSSRAIPPHFVGADSAYFLGTNRNKKSIAVDLKTADGLDIVTTLIRQSDVVVENFRPGVCSRLGLDAEQLRAERPALIWASISGFGKDGPLAQRPAYDMIVQAMSGVMSLTGMPGGPSVRLGIPAGDLVAGMYSVIGILAALSDVARGGEGRHVDVSMLDGMLSMLSYQGVYSLVSGTVPQPQGSRHDSIPTYRSFESQDGRELVVTANTERMWRDLCRVLGRDDLLHDPRFQTASDRLANQYDLDPLLEKAFLEEPAQVWVDRLTECSVPAALIETVPTALAAAENADRDMVLRLEHPDGSAVSVLGDPVHFVGAPPRRHHYPPRLGEHAAEILRDRLGLAADEIARLRQIGVVGMGEGHD